jgi:D-beta-D-heptose 7-phosphate kinase/D-beta-D-heptose 1-phosphate adenosyltransferase
VIVSSIDALAELGRELRAAGSTIVFTNGVFDILHAGHVTYLQVARSFGDVLVLGINADDSVRRLKGPQRPLNTLSDRMIVVDALRCVDYVISFAQDTPLDLIRALQPDVLVKGGDYVRETVVGAEDVESWGGRVEIVPLLEGRSTTNLITRARTV